MIIEHETITELDDELVALRQWAKAAYAVIQQGVLLMDAEQLGQWEGVRAVAESAPPCVDVLHDEVSE